MINELLVAITEWLGTIAFAVSGSLVAIGCGLDLFGVSIVGCVTAVGGGMLRDILLGIAPPQVFSKPLVLILALLTTLIVFTISYFNAKKFKDLREKIERMNLVFDALGLASFSVTGVEVACSAGACENAVLAITLGVITAVGGGVLRDVLVNEKPYVLTKHIYALASLCGSGIYYLMGEVFGLKIWGTVISIAITLLIRLLAAHFHWKLPKIKLG